MMIVLFIFMWQLFPMSRIILRGQGYINKITPSQKQLLCQCDPFSFFPNLISLTTSNKDDKRQSLELSKVVEVISLFIHFGFYLTSSGQCCIILIHNLRLMLGIFEPVYEPFIIFKTIVQNHYSN